MERIETTRKMPDNEAKKEKIITDDVPGNKVDLSGSNLDDAMENKGIEVEEKNYYSIGIDDHNKLRENKED
ncbi:hypothetical protein [Flavihumibacter profundi]|jgi:hypothetical protein|uniref:hypothetical protein n=1 Tax=Flavihumibacter profundi TaxID=2716883 RepID=UPI001CC55519|nr:hypothetical protein [Flavihumibacter profundi]MBZ5856997.1 hypothetical protein [Flavihumibacter profundi]